MADAPTNARSAAAPTSPELVFPAGDDESQGVTEFRLLRKRLAELTPSRVLLVTSPGRDEGKSAVAANLAMCCAEYGRARVLLIEAHFAHPRLAAMFALQPPTCFAFQLLERQRGGARQPWRPAAVPGQSLGLLAVAQNGPKASASWPSFQAVLSELREQPYHDIIIIDGPPALDSADASIIAQQADQVILVGVAGRSRTGPLAEAAERLAPAKVAGVVLLAEERRRKRR